MTIALEVLIVAHMFYYTVVYKLTSRLVPYIPTAKAESFTALLGKGKKDGGILSHQLL
jgi:hypothetical protein